MEVMKVPASTGTLDNKVLLNRNSIILYHAKEGTWFYEWTGII